jgi:hypothetical protein
MTDKLPSVPDAPAVSRRNSPSFEGHGLSGDPCILMAPSPVPSVPVDGGARLALKFEMLVDAPLTSGHQRYRTEGWLNEGLETHLRDCRECARTIAKDLREFADQIEMRAMKIANRGTK